MIVGPDYMMTPTVFEIARSKFKGWLGVYILNIDIFDLVFQMFYLIFVFIATYM